MSDRKFYKTFTALLTRNKMSGAHRNHIRLQVLPEGPVQAGHRLVRRHAEGVGYERPVLRRVQSRKRGHHLHAVLVAQWLVDSFGFKVFQVKLLNSFFTDVV